MTENEAVREMTFEEEYEILQKEKKELFSMEDENSETPFANYVVRRALRCIRKLLEEIQQYRAIGTVEECAHFKKKQHMADVAVEYCKKHEELGTVEELRTLKEKAELKKPIRNDLCTCPSCGTHNEVIKKRRNTVVRDTVYCWHCGQAIECQRDIDLD